MSKMKLSGAEIKAYWADEAEWETREVEDMTIKVNGVENRDVEISELKDDDAVELSEAFVYDHEADRGYNLVTLIRNWQKKRSSKNVLINVSEADVPALLAAIKTVKSAKVIS